MAHHELPHLNLCCLQIQLFPVFLFFTLALEVLIYIPLLNLSLMEYFIHVYGLFTALVFRTNLILVNVFYRFRLNAFRLQRVLEFELCVSVSTEHQCRYKMTFFQHHFEYFH